MRSRVTRWHLGFMIGAALGLIAHLATGEMVVSGMVAAIMVPAGMAIAQSKPIDRLAYTYAKKR